MPSCLLRQLTLSSRCYEKNTKTVGQVKTVQPDFGAVISKKKSIITISILSPEKDIPIQLKQNHDYIL